MTTAAQWIANYGYWAVLAGALLEGETVLLLAGFAAQQGVLSLPVVIAVAFVGAVAGDQGFYFAGRYFGARLVARYPSLQRRVAEVNELLERHDAWVIVAARFAYGLRIAGPILIGTSTVPPRRFLLFNALGAVLWAPLVAGVGYVFGGSLAWLMDRLGWLQAVVLVAGVGAAAVMLWRKMRSGRANVEPRDTP